MPYIIYADMESLIKKVGGYANNSEYSFTTKIQEHILCPYSMSTIWAFDNIENKHTIICRKYCMKKFCESLREHGKYIIDFEKKNFALTKKGSKSYQNAKACYICEKRILKNLCKNINYWKARNHCHYTETYRGTTHGICNLKFNVPNEIPVDSNGSNYV